MCTLLSIVNNWWCFLKIAQEEDQESHAVTRKPRDAAAVVFFGLKFADNVHYKFKSIAKLRKPGFRAPNIPAQKII